MGTDSPNHNQQRSYDQCNDLSSRPDLNMDNAPPYCDDDPAQDINNKRRINDESLNWLKDQTMKKTGYGARVDADPMIGGQIINDPANPQRDVLYRYSKSIRGTDEAMLDLFRNVVVIDEDGKAWPIPVMMGPPEKAVAAMIQENVRKDETLVVNRLRLPLLALTQSGIEYDMSRYTYHRAVNLFKDVTGKPGIYASEKYNRDTVFGFARGIPVNITYVCTAWTMYREDMNQIVEQVMTKFSPTAYIRVTGVPWEIIVKLDSLANNLNAEPGDQAIRVIKYEFNMTVQTYIPQPIERKKAVLKTKIDFVDGLSEEEITAVLARIETSVKELEC
jgi:hypothetical protein